MSLEYLSILYDKQIKAFLILRYRTPVYNTYYINSIIMDSHKAHFVDNIDDHIRKVHAKRSKTL